MSKAIKSLIAAIVFMTVLSVAMSVFVVPAFAERDAIVKCTDEQHVMFNSYKNSWSGITPFKHWEIFTHVWIKTVDGTCHMYDKNGTILNGDYELDGLGHRFAHIDPLAPNPVQISYVQGVYIWWP